MVHLNMAPKIKGNATNLLLNRSYVTINISFFFSFKKHSTDLIELALGIGLKCLNPFIRLQNLFTMVVAILNFIGSHITCQNRIPQNEYLYECQNWWRYLKPQLRYYNLKTFSMVILTLNFDPDITVFFYFCDSEHLCQMSWKLDLKFLKKCWSETNEQFSNQPSNKHTEWGKIWNKHEGTIDQELTVADAQTLSKRCMHTAQWPGGITFLCEMTSCPPSWNCDIKPEIWLR